MNEVTLTKEEYAELLQAKVRLDCIKDYISRKSDHYLSDEVIRTYAGGEKKEDAGE